MADIEELLAGLDIDRRLVNEKLQSLSLHGAAQSLAYFLQDPDYQLLAGRLQYAHLESQIVKPYSKAILDDRFDKIIDPELTRFVTKHAAEIDKIIESDRHSRLRYNWISVRTLEIGYIKKYREQPLEDVRYAIMRMAVHIFKNTPNALRDIETFYRYVSHGYFTPASPTWFHAGTRYPQMKSCFLTEVDDNIESIVKEAYTDTALISKEGGGNGVHITRLRHSTVRSSGKSGGVVPWMRMWNEQARAIDQGGHRKGAFTFFLAAWHKDVQVFADLRLTEGNPDMRTPHLNICVWYPDLFFIRVLNDENWSLFCPNQAPGLADCWGSDFERLYVRYENSDTPRTTIKARELMAQICSNSIVCGEPFAMAGDACNALSNQQHDCVHQGSNLCLEIIEKASSSQIAACNLASICLPAFVSDKHFDFSKFGEVCRFVVKVLNRVTATNFYPVERIKHSDDLHSPIGIGTQGWANVLAMLDMAWVEEDGSPNEDALQLKEKIWACKYYNTLRESCDIAKANGGPYKTFKGSPLSQGQFQFNLWATRHAELGKLPLPSFDNLADIKERDIVMPNEWGDSETSWETLRNDIVAYGVANSLLNADMPTATTAHIQGNVESFEPATYNLYVRRVLAGDCYVYNNHLVKDLKNLGLWDLEIVEFLKAHNGSIQGLTDYLEEKHQYFAPAMKERLTFLERKYLTAFEIPVMVQSDFSTVSGPYVCQSSSFNIYKASPTVKDVYNILMYRWMSGHKTLAYYLRTESAVDPFKYTTKNEKNTPKKVKCEGDVCMMCE